MTRNNTIYFWRIIFTYIIALHHLRNCFGQVTSWYVAVDFFAVVSGYLLMHHSLNHPDESVWEYAKKKFYKFCPLIFITSIIRLLIETYYTPIPWRNVGQKIVSALPDYLVLNAYYVAPSLNSVDWYIQMLFAISIPLFYLLKKHRDFTVQFIAPICVLLSYSYIFKQFNYLEGYAVQKRVLDGVVNMPLIRVGGGIMLGIISYYWTQKISDLNIWLRNVIEVSCLAFVIICSRIYGKNPMEFLYILLMFIGISFAFCHQAKIRFFNSNFIKFLSQLSLYVYLTHYFIRIIFRNEFTSYSSILALGYLITVTLVSAILYFLMTKTIILLKRISND